MERWFHLSPHLSSATLLSWETQTIGNISETEQDNDVPIVIIECLYNVTYGLKLFDTKIDDLE